MNWEYIDVATRLPYKFIQIVYGEQYYSLQEWFQV